MRLPPAESIMRQMVSDKFLSSVVEEIDKELREL